MMENHPKKCQILSECVNKIVNNSCTYEWDEYTNNYWLNYDEKDSYHFSGLEQYQIQINESTKFNPHFWVSKNNPISTLEKIWTYIVIGCGYEYYWGFAYIIENALRFRLPTLLEQVIPLYGFLQSQFKMVFNRFSQFALSCFNVKSSSTEEVDLLINFINKHFSDNSNEFIFMVGQSVSGSTIK